MIDHLSAGNRFRALLSPARATDWKSSESVRVTSLKDSLRFSVTGAG